jgi:glycine oxidase
MPDSTDILVVGGGVMGLWGALKAAEAGLSVTLVDAGEIGRGASGGLLGALFPWMPDRWDAKKQYQLDALVSLPVEIARLEALTGLSANFRRVGRIIPLPGDHLRVIAKRHERDAGINWNAGPERFHWHVRDGAPDGIELAPDCCAAGHVFDTLAARIEPRALIRLLRASLELQPNVRIVEHARLASLDAKRGRAEVVVHPPLSCRTSPPQEGRVTRGEALPQEGVENSSTTFERGGAGAPSTLPPCGGDVRQDRGGYDPDAYASEVTFSHALIAAGTASFPILETLLPPLPKPLGQGVKGQAALLRADLDPASPVVFLDGIYVVAHEGGLAAIGSTSENRFDDPDTTDAQLDDVIARARTLIPSLRDAAVVERWAGIRPKAIGRDPLVGPMPGHPSIIALTGGFKITFGLAHRLADSALDFVLGRDFAALPPGFTVEGQLAKELGWTHEPG